MSTSEEDVRKRDVKHKSSLGFVQLYTSTYCKIIRHRTMESFSKLRELQSSPMQNACEVSCAIPEQIINIAPVLL